MEIVDETPKTPNNKENRPTIEESQREPRTPRENETNRNQESVENKEEMATNKNKFDVKKLLNDSWVAWGVTLVVIGALYLIKSLKIFDADCFLFQPKNFLLYAGIIFLACRSYVLGGLWLIFGALAHMDMILKVVEKHPGQVFPILIIVIGIVVIALHQHGRKS